MREVIAVPVVQEEDNQLNLEASLRQILVAYPDISTIVCSSTRETLGVVSALIDMNRIHDTLVVGLDTNEEIEAHLRTGVVDVAIYVDYFKVGNQAMTHLFKYLQGEFVSMYSTVDVSFATQWSMNEQTEEAGENHEK
jgi:ABC-type sugar transport system substrate-binding protein